MGLADLVCASYDEYIDTAVRLGRDPEFRRDIRARIVSGRSALFDDVDSIRALENFLADATAPDRR